MSARIALPSKARFLRATGLATGGLWWTPVFVEWEGTGGEQLTRREARAGFRRRTRKAKNQEEWTQNGENIRTVQTVLAGKWAERGKPALFQKLVTMEANCADPDRVNNYDDLLLAELKAAYAKLKADSGSNQPL